MKRSNRLFEIIQILRAARRPMTGRELADKLEVSMRTIYRDVAALQAMNTPIEGEPGIGYVMRRGYDLPPLNFDLEEIEALRVGLSMLSRTGDGALTKAAQRVSGKIEALQQPADWLQVSPWGAPPDDPQLGCVSKSMLRDAVRAEQKLRITYRDEDDNETVRTVRPIALVYHVECVLLAAWCELRHAFRHFRADRIWACELLDAHFTGQSQALRSVWLEQNRFDGSDETAEAVQKPAAATLSPSVTTAS